MCRGSLIFCSHGGKLELAAEVKEPCLFKVIWGCGTFVANEEDASSDGDDRVYSLD